MKKTDANNYNRAAYFYDALSNIYSGFQIIACKRHQMLHIKLGDRVLYAGAGGADDAILAASKGAQVTLVELSINMINKSRKKIERAEVQENIELIHGDILQFDTTDFDVVVANFFLNVFDRETMPMVFLHLNGLLKKGGLFLIADFTPLKGNIVLQLFQSIYYGVALLSFAILAKNPLHKIYDYRTYFSQMALTEVEVKDFPLFGFGPQWFRVIVAKKNT